jgi:hypothetical protein
VRASTHFLETSAVTARLTAGGARGDLAARGHALCDSPDPNPQASGRIPGVMERGVLGAAIALTGRVTLGFSAEPGAFFSSWNTGLDLKRTVVADTELSVSLSLAAALRAYKEDQMSERDELFFGRLGHRAAQQGARA